MGGRGVVGKYITDLMGVLGLFAKYLFCDQFRGNCPEAGRGYVGRERVERRLMMRVAAWWISARRCNLRGSRVKTLTMGTMAYVPDLGFEEIV